MSGVGFASAGMRRTALTVACGTLTAAGMAICALAVTGLAPHRPATADFGVMPSSARVERDGAASTAADYRRTPMRLPGPGPLSAAAPVAVHIPALHVDATVQSVATADGQLTVPDAPTIVGWWAGSARPGSRSGSVVLAGHVDSASRGLGAFFRLTALRAGDVVTLTTARHDRVTYRVTARRSYPKTRGLPEGLFLPSGPARLVLVTCGGTFDRQALSYRDNVVVFAAPAA